MTEWSLQRVEQLAPDAAAVKAAQGLAKPAKWQNLGRDARTLWGECQGSGTQPYQVRVDLDDVAYKCSCPSRKLPCKHSLGLLLLMASGATLPVSTPPAFVEEWTSGRAKRAEARQNKETPATAAPPDLEARAKRTQKREGRIADGLDQLETWLQDVVAQGLAATRAQPTTFWLQMAARLVDAQAPGVARRVRALADTAVANRDWQSKLLVGIGQLQLLVDAYRNIDNLPAGLAADVRTLIGWTQDQDSLRERGGLRDRWVVVGRRQVQDEQLRVQYTWLLGSETRRFALILEFAAGNQPLPANYVIGQILDAELAYFDSATPLRALEHTRHASVAWTGNFPNAVDIATLQSEHAARIALNPWVEQWPVVLGPVYPLLEGDRFYLASADGRRIAMRPSFRQQWHLLALAGTDPLTLFGEWDGETFDPQTLQCRGELFLAMRLGEMPVLSRVA